ncbi:MAG: type II secretion system F family protein [Bacillota bacterium]|nr:type II secretion system F family protein [Bacillota bacterium]
MPKYHYKAKNMAGNTIEGVYEAQTKDAVINMIRQKYYYPLEVKELIERKDINELGIFGRIKANELSIYCKQFCSILRAGVPLIHCLGLLGEQTDNPILKSITLKVREDVQKGSSLSQAMERHGKKFPSMLINMVAAGEASGSLDHSLEVMSIHFEKEHITKQKVKSALRYPVIVSVVAIFVVIFLIVKVIPVFEGMFASSGSELPLPTRVLLSLSDFLQANGLVLLAILAIIIGGLKLFFMGETQRLKMDKFKYKMPVFGSFMVKSAAASFARNMSSLMATGVPITESLEITGKVLGNTYALKCIEQVIEKVKEGEGLHNPIKDLKLFPPMLENMIMMGEESGTLDEMLAKTADFYDDEVVWAAESLTSMLQPSVIIVLGFFVALIVLAFALPMFDSFNMATL